MEQYEKGFSQLVAIALLAGFIVPPADAQIEVDTECEMATVSGQEGFIDFRAGGGLVVISTNDEITELASIDLNQHPQCKPHLEEPLELESTEASGDVASATVSDPGSISVTASVEEKQAAMLAAVNTLRSTPTVCRGVTLAAVPPLTRAVGLDASAQAHSDDMASNNYFAHKGRNNSTFSSRAKAEGYKNFATGENIAAGSATVGAAIKNWLGSKDGHCEALMTTESTEMGSGGATNPDSQWTNYWTFVTGRPR